MLRFVLVPLIPAVLLVLPLLPPAAQPATPARLAARTQIAVEQTTTSLSHSEALYRSLTLSSVAPTTTQAPKPVPVTAAPVVIRRTVTTRAPVTTTTSLRHSLSGAASWWRAGGCAMNEPPMGVTVTVTNVANGKTTRCTIIDRGPHVAGRIIDMDYDSFARIADPSSGVANVRVTW